MGRAREHAREAPATELQLAEYLREAFQFVGAQAFVTRYGVEMVRAAIDDMREGGRGQAAIRNPAGFLRWLVAQQETP